MIQIRDLSMRYPLPKRYRDYVLRPLSKRREVAALQDVSLAIERGARVALLGPNGAGKTTLLKLIGGLLLPTQGQVVVNGFDTIERNAGVRRSIGFVMNEERSFFWRLTGYQNLEFFGSLDNLYGKSLRERCREVLGFVGLDEAADRRVSEYSSGMKQRLAIARGLLGDPEVLILDEPTRAVDPLASEELIELILSEIHSRARKGLLIATHRLDEVTKLCDRVLVIDKGRLISYEPLASLCAREESLEAYYRRCVGAPRRKEPQS